MNSVPTSSSRLRPRILPLTANRRRWSSLSRIRFLPMRFFEHLVFRSQVLDHFLLLAIDPASEDDDIELPRLKDEIHDRSIGVKCVEMAFTIR